MHNSFLQRNSVLPGGEEHQKKRERGKKRDRKELQRACLESSPGQRRRRDEDLILPSTTFPFHLFFIAGGEPPDTLRAEQGGIKFPQMFYS